LINIEVTAEEYLPLYATEGSAGADLRSVINYTLKKGEIKLFPTGIKMAIPVGYEVQIRPRSGLALKHGITLPNSPGTIDSDYRQDIGVILQNLGESDFEIKKGDRIAQMVLAKYETAQFIITDELDKTERNGGFGSTGVK
jgi:dUTP pyrophosphatase